MPTIKTLSYLFGFEYAFSHVHIKIEHHSLATLFFGFAKGRFNSVFTFYAFSITKFLIDGILWILMAKNQQMLINTNIHVGKAAK